MTSEAMQGITEMIRARAVSRQNMTLEQRRADMEAAQARLALPDDVSMTPEIMAGVPCRSFSVPASRPDRVLMYLHGGGYVMGSTSTHAELMARLAGVCRCRVLGVDYRLAPEHPYPAAVEDAVAVYRALANGGARLAVAGDSAGGGLAAAMLLQLKAARLALPCAAVLLSPWTDLTGTSETYVTRAAVDPMIKPEGIRGMAALYRGATPAEHPLVSPLSGDLAGLPALLIQVGDYEILLNDAVKFAERAVSAGVAVELQVWPQAFHVFQTVPALPEAHEAVASAARFLDSHWV